ncbi:phage holin family protein [Escherichia coli]|uniref:phage holin family protein n=1 Tax=Escherichia coli TaxID=562 RepID=UPI0028DED6B5|nr:phage holin family protein [Escherichia coli]MDT9158836.1 phage holin family protein [Escherichia coli]
MCDFTIMLLSILGGVHSFLNGVREKRYEASYRQLMAECIAAVLAGFIGMYFAEYKSMDESLQNCVTIICSINNRLILEKLQRIIDSYLNRNAS